MNKGFIDHVDELVNGMGKEADNSSVKRIKSNNGLIENVTIKKVIITEDNKQLLND